MYVPLRKYGGMVVPTPTSKIAVPHTVEYDHSAVKSVLSSKIIFTLALIVHTVQSLFLEIFFFNRK